MPSKAVEAEAPLVALRRRHRLTVPLYRNLLSEFFCTFLHMYLGFCVNAQTILSRLQMNNHIGMPLGWGFGLIFSVQAGYAISGSHLNPAVSLFNYSFGSLSFAHMILYSIAQTAGAFLGAMLTYILYYEKMNEFDGGTRQITGTNATAGIFATYPGSHLSITGSVIDQISCTATLCVIIGIITDARNKIPRFMHPLLFGIMLSTICMGFGLNAGNAMNPARDFGPRLFTYVAGYGWGVFSYRNYKWVWVPIVCPMVGAMVGAWVYQLVLGIHIPDDVDEASGGNEMRLLQTHDANQSSPTAAENLKNGQLITDGSETAASNRCRFKEIPL